MVVVVRALSPLPNSSSPPLRSGMTLPNAAEIAFPRTRTLGSEQLLVVNAMQNKPFLTHDDARAVAAAAEAEARRQSWAVTIAVVDDGGHLLWLQRLDGAAPISAQIAPAKARTAALGRRESKVYEDMINGPRAAFLSAPGLEGMLEGGVPVMVAGHCIGAVGVSGVKAAEDAQVARAGIAALAG
jgi:glc operon protein GlcG